MSCLSLFSEFEKEKVKYRSESRYTTSPTTQYPHNMSINHRNSCFIKETLTFLLNTDRIDITKRYVITDLQVSWSYIEDLNEWFASKQYPLDSRGFFQRYFQYLEQSWKSVCAVFSSNLVGQSNLEVGNQMNSLHYWIL